MPGLKNMVIFKSLIINGESYLYEPNRIIAGSELIIASLSLAYFSLKSFKEIKSELSQYKRLKKWK